MPAETTIKHRRGTAAQWSLAESVLADSEIGVETDTGKFKIGNGSFTWSELPYQPNLFADNAFVGSTTNPPISVSKNMVYTEITSFSQGSNWGEVIVTAPHNLSVGDPIILKGISGGITAPWISQYGNSTVKDPFFFVIAADTSSFTIVHGMVYGSMTMVVSNGAFTKYTGTYSTAYNQWMQPVYTPTSSTFKVSGAVGDVAVDDAGGLTFVQASIPSNTAGSPYLSLSSNGINMAGPSGPSASASGYGLSVSQSDTTGSKSASYSTSFQLQRQNGLEGYISGKMSFGSSSWGPTGEVRENLVIKPYTENTPAIQVEASDNASYYQGYSSVNEDMQVWKGYAADTLSQTVTPKFVKVKTNGDVVIDGNIYAANLGGDVPEATPTVSGTVYGSTNNSGTSALGFEALTSNTSGTNNTALGYRGLTSNTIGNNNVAVGMNALNANTEGGANVAVGHGALQGNIAGGGNVAIGDTALSGNQTGSGNIAIGYLARYLPTTGENNITIGSFSQVNYSGTSNISIGASSMGSGAGSSSYNVGVGDYSLATTTGHNNVAVGYGTLGTAGSDNVAIGYGAGSSTTGNGNIFIGKGAGQLETGSNMLYIGNNDLGAPLIKGNANTGNLYFYSNVYVSNGATVVGTLTADAVAKSGGTSSQFLKADGSVDSSTYLSVTNTAVSSNITLAAKTKYFVDTTAARTLTLPASPALGDEIQIFDATGTAGTNNISVANNSNKINGVLDSALLDVNGVAAVFIYTGSTYGWRMG